MSENLLSADLRYCQRGDRELFSHLNVRVNTGELLQVVGANGAGKTTLLRALCGLAEVEFESLVWRSQGVDSALQYADELLYLGHKLAIRSRMTIRENWAWYRQIGSPDAFDESLNNQLLSDESLLQELCLAGYEDEPISSLSAGQKRRAALARLRLTPSRLWMLDEPFTALDQSGVDVLCRWMRSFTDAGGAVVYSTHQRVDLGRDVCTLSLGSIGS